MNDVAFQYVFGSESNKDLLMALLNELIPELHITELNFNKQRQTSFAKDLKNSVFDVSCRLVELLASRGPHTRTDDGQPPLCFR